jgi:uncharacterized membrane protein
MILAGTLVAFALITYFRPTFGLGLILALLPTYLIRYNFHNLPTTYLELLLVIFLIIIFIKNSARLPELKKLGNINWLILAFVLAGIISSIIMRQTHEQPWACSRHSSWNRFYFSMP